MKTPNVFNEKRQINIVLNNDELLQPIKKETNKTLNVIEQYFQQFIGLETIKHHMKEIYATNVIHTKRKEKGLMVDRQVLHMIFMGNPGTGKTTIARHIATVLFELNILSKGHFIEAERADLVGEYIGQTAQKTRALIQKALGGVLFIDEAYSLARGGHKDFGREAIDTLVKQMEDYANDFVLILAGYPAEMEYFLQMNPGLRSRFPFILTFPDYSIDELMQIAEQIAHLREYKLTPDAKWKLRQHLKEITITKQKHFANARYVRNIIEQAIRKQSFRLVETRKFSYDDLLYIEARDLNFSSV